MSTALAIILRPAGAALAVQIAVANSASSRANVSRAQSALAEAQRTHERHATQTGGTYHCALRQFGQAGVFGRYPGITRVFPLQHTGQGKTGG